ncbi:inorganic diphosphatase [Leptospira barantonii]|uniref:Inorganic pyrophosphatase n=1 Tax=Leptospira barantonii TaxID=2023184 RepID=A0ABX4NPM8_9LEPT|nr:inorganic diphosphatase [Leptospira barantonii]PJZ56928.1 inorganic pyrophosphatase [Leptospira barantonii]
MVHPWHDISPGEQCPEFVNGVIEIKRGSRAKYEVDKEYGILKLDRVLYSSFYYPANYGFIPQSYCGDHDPLDILVLSQVELEPLCLVKAKVIGVMRMLDSGEEDDKIIAVAANDMSVNHINDISELPPHFTLELKHFFEDYKKLENKTVVIEEFQNAKLARQIVLDSLELYKKTFPKK